jgi:fusion and transport protein UGO1
VPVGPYKGVWGTMWWIVREEGVSVGTTMAGQKGGIAKQQQRVEKRRVVRKGQGMSGLWRGWRVGFWGLVGVWGASALGGPAAGDEF